MQTLKIYEIVWIGCDLRLHDRYLCKDIETAKSILDLDIRDKILKQKRKRLIKMINKINDKDFSEYFPRSYFEGERDRLKKLIKKVQQMDFSKVEAPFEIELGEFEGIHLQKVKVLEKE